MSCSLAAVAFLALTSAVSATPNGSAFPKFDKRQSNTNAFDILGSAFGIPGPNQTFDYIIVGGGNAGLAVAARLAEVSTNTVAVIEAGTFYEISNGNNSEVPATDITYVGKDVNDWHPGIDWGFVTTPQAGLDGNRSHYARGKVLGGSSARNYMTYHAPTTQSLQLWADTVGDQSYTYANFYPWYKKHQKFTPPDMSRRFPNSTVEYDAASFATGGPVSVIYPNYATAFATWAKRAFAEVGIPNIAGFMSGKLIGNAYGPATIDFTTNVRASSEFAYLRPQLLKETPNLIVFPRHLAKKVVFNANKRATGVTVDTDGYTYTISARREVIISAGAFQSPQLLMVSGIGPQATLQRFNIPVLSNRPGVGQNMWDHILFGPSWRVNVLTGSAFANPAYEAQQVSLFHQGRGALASPNNDVFAFEKLPNKRNFTAAVNQSLAYFPADWPEIEYIAPQGYFGYCNNFNRDAPVDGFNYASIVAGIVAPSSRGNISISSADTRDPPLINPNWLTHPADQALAIASYKRTRQMWQAPSARNITIGTEAFPGPIPTNTDAQLLQLIKKSMSTIFHAACTCAMGKISDPNAVVDTRAQVIGVTGLRVVDASTFPILPPGHPMSTVYALAEKIADDIKRTTY